MPNESGPSAGQQNTEISSYFAAALNNQALLDNQHGARQQAADERASARAWEAAKLRSFINAETADQTGATDNEQAITPMRQGAADAIAATPGVAAGQVAANIANTATDNLTLAVAAVQQSLAQVATLLAALQPATVTAAQPGGGAA